ncbi:lasso peptide isopeptide bond-forming cyclase [Neobacillus sp. YIM B06451]|uniref:lasso peptide isopeptide bond-forming cyclase n=1 Tax=Neobacillus sp. YIM B06451 TaxID=3070994 RepID=UPI002931DF9B|nr:lasso peptide isopeptide bond-forming cyclase [Neobacillus sp. YIM B06451]
MSAITGIIHFNDEPVNDSKKMMKALDHFPVDTIQTWNDGNAFFCCHSQWITPESVGETLPYYDCKAQLTITADAIIDNRYELFEMLNIKPFEQKNITDSQLLLHAYKKWGEECPRFLIGDFAFMIWDKKKQLLFGARDFSGGRTLYYNSCGQRFAFCTTIEPLFTLPYVRKELNEGWLAEFLAVSSVVDTVDVSSTPYKNIAQLPPSHSISVAGGKINLKRYCTLNAGKPLILRSSDEYVEAFQSVFNQAVQCRLRTYRAIGSHLSGGLDSGAVVSFAVKQLSLEKKPLHTFSYIPPSDFNDYTPKYLLPDERPFIQSTVHFLGGIKNHYLDFDGRNPFSEINDFLEILEMPYKFFENSFWIKGVFEKAHQVGAGVLLSGGRGNLSISWGSALDYYAVLLKRMKWIKLFKELNHYSQNVGGARLRRIPGIARLAYPFLDRIFPSNPQDPFSVMINPDFAKKTNVHTKLKEHGMDSTGWLSTSNIFEHRKNHFEELFHWNATNTLATKLSVRYSLWKRDPTNDLRVIRFCLSVPEEQYVQNGMDRSLIRKSTKNYLPDKVRLNQKIKGVQGADWLHRMGPYWNNFIDELEQLTKDERILEYIDGQTFKKAFERAKKEGPRPEMAPAGEYRLLMRSLILFRYLKRFN